MDELKSKTLYVSDLDGTLLRSNQKTSSFTNQTINELVKKGVMFSYATARSYITARKVTDGMTAAFPLIVYNGAFICDNAKGKILIKNFFEKEDALSLIKRLIEGGVSPIVYGFVKGQEKFSYNESEINQATKDFVLSRKGDIRDRPVSCNEQLTEGEIFYITCIDSPEKLEPFLKEYESIYHCIYQRDIYSGEQWLEIIPKSVSKANAIKQLQKELRCKRLVVFGDGMNDIDMFQIADEAYAVQNAVQELKDFATGIIASNDEDGVAKWLNENI